MRLGDILLLVFWFVLLIWVGFKVWRTPRG